MLDCYCDSGFEFSACCGKFIDNREIPSTPEELMRSRYSAYKVKNIDYLVATTHPDYRKYYSRKSISNWANSVEFMKLTIHESIENHVKFSAFFKDERGNLQEHREDSLFKFEDGNWYYLEGEDF
ncbi:MAG: YchJ family protein [Fluviicola sp.]|jgi:SEC-C motif-containing protein